MGKKQSSFSFQRSAESLQDNVRRAGPAAGASYTLIGAIILLGGIGDGIDHILHRDLLAWDAEP